MMQTKTRFKLDVDPTALSAFRPNGENLSVTKTAKNKTFGHITTSTFNCLTPEPNQLNLCTKVH